MDISYIINQLGEERENYFNAVAPPLIQSSNFAFKGVSDLKEKLKDESEHPFYTRGHNPTVAILRKKLAALSHGEDALVLSSGSAAMAAAVVNNVKAGDHVVCVAKPYSWTHKLLINLLSRFGVEHTFVDGKVADNFKTTIKPNTTLFILESPNSLTFELQDIPAVTAIAKANGIITICDNSYSTALNQSPLLMGVDIVMHSGSKYYGGHSDIVAGVLVSSKEKIKKIFDDTYMTFGACISPHDAWLMLRSLRTLPIRLEKIADTTEKVVRFLEEHPKVEKVMWPWAKNNEQIDLAKKQQCRAGGLFSILLNTKSIPDIENFVNALKRFLIAVSWGGHESLVFPACVFHGEGSNYKNEMLPVNLVRMYCGLEEPNVLMDDLKQALGKIN